MASPFEKLRLPPSARRTVAACALGVAGLAARALGTVITVPKNITVGSIIFKSLRRTTATVALPGGATVSLAYGIRDVTYHHGGITRDDAFDGGAGLIVNGLPFNLPGGKVDRTTTAAGVFVNTITPQNFSGVHAGLNYFMSANSRVLRSIGFFTNTTGVTQTITVDFGANLGSDSNTTIRATSSGDLTLQVSQDSYVVSNQNGQSGNPKDPTETWVFFGPGGKPATGGHYVNGNTYVGEEYSLTLAPGQTKELMWFIQFNDDLAQALSNTSIFSTFSSLNAAGLLSGLSATELAEIENWLASASGPILQNSAPVNIPTTADFVVSGPVVTGGGNNTVNTLTFMAGSSLKIFNTLTVTTGPVELVNGSSIDLENATLKTNLLNVDFGGFLGGNGTIFGNLFNAGTVSPGHSPGQIHVTGNYVQSPTGTLTIQFAGHKKGQFDVLSVDGSAKLNGTLQLQALDKFKLHRGDNFKFLTAGGGVSGAFAHVENPFVTDTILNPTLIYSDKSVSLQVRTFETFANDWDLTPNQKSVARALDSINYDSRATKLTKYVDNQPLALLPVDFDKISPQKLTAMYTIGISLEKVQSLNVQRRTDDIRSGSRGFSAAGLAINGDGPGFSGPVAFRTGVAGPNGGPDGKDSKIEKTIAPIDDRWGAFLSGTGEWVSVGDTQNARGYNLESGGFTLGVDYKVTPNLAVGLAAGYTGTTADLTDGGKIRVNGGKLGLYATFFQNQLESAAPTMSKDSKEVKAPAVSVAKGLYADLAVFGGYNSYGTNRTGLEGTARGDTDGGELNVLFGAGYDFKQGNLTFGPTASFNYTYIGTNGFTEHGSLAPLNIHGGKGDSLRTAFGFKASYDWKVGGVLVKPELRAAWQHEYGDSAYAIDSSFANGAGNSFLVNGPKMGRDAALLGAGFAVQFNERMSTYFYYDGELGRTNYHSASVTGGVRLAF